MPRDPYVHHDLDRRAVLRATLLALGVGPFTGCGRDDEDDPGPAPAPGPDRASIAPPAPEPAWRRPPTLEPLVRVRLERRVDPRPIEAGHDGADLILITTNGTAPATGPVRIERDTAPDDVDAHGTWRWTDAAGRSGQLIGDALDIGPAMPDPRDRSLDARPVVDLGGVMRWQGLDLPGLIRLVPGSRNDDDAVTAPPPVHVLMVAGMERYLPGVLARELFPRWAPATHAALAVAARSFATFATLERSDRAWDLESDQRSQVFAGDTGEDRPRAAVAATSGIVLTYAGDVIPAYYSSTCGGIGMPATVAIGSDPANAVPPLAGHALGDCCSSAPRWSWSSVRTTARLTTQLRAWSRANPRRAGEDWRHVASVRSIDIARRTPGGRPLAYEVTVRDDGDRTRRLEVAAPDLRRALHSDRRRDEAPVWSGFLEPVVEQDGSIRFDGRGWGHGAGLCQYGAQRLAREGWGHERILQAYYPGAALTQAWSPASIAG